MSTVSGCTAQPMLRLTVTGNKGQGALKNQDLENAGLLLHPESPPFAQKVRRVGSGSTGDGVH